MKNKEENTVRKLIISFPPGLGDDLISHKVKTHHLFKKTSTLFLDIKLTNFIVTITKDKSTRIVHVMFMIPRVGVLVLFEHCYIMCINKRYFNHTYV